MNLTNLISHAINMLCLLSHAINMLCLLSHAINVLLCLFIVWLENNTCQQLCHIDIIWNIIYLYIANDIHTYAVPIVLSLCVCKRWCVFRGVCTCWCVPGCVHLLVCMPLCVRHKVLHMPSNSLYRDTSGCVTYLCYIAFELHLHKIFSRQQYVNCVGWLGKHLYGDVAVHWRNKYFRRIKWPME